MKKVSDLECIRDEIANGDVDGIEAFDEEIVGITIRALDILIDIMNGGNDNG